MADKLYYAKGLEVWKSPVRTKIEGGESVSVGFLACTASDVVGEEGAIAIAALLCLGEQAQTPSPHMRQGYRRPQGRRTMMEPVAWTDQTELATINDEPAVLMWSAETHKDLRRKDREQIPLVRLSDAEARIKELETKLALVESARDHFAKSYGEAEARAEAAEALLKEAREKALEEAASFIDAHAALEKAGICDLSGASDPPLTKEAAKSVFEANAKKSTQAATYKTIAAHFRALKEKP